VRALHAEHNWDQVYEFLSVFGPHRKPRPRHNIAPTTNIDAVRPGENGRELVTMRWGLIPG
jgi:putative SOS response-associated peptidase YedK